MQLCTYVVYVIVHFQDPKLIATGLNMIEWSLHNGWDEKYGGIFYFLDRSGKSPTLLVSDVM